MSRNGYYDTSAMVRSRSITPLTPEMSKILPFVTDKTISRHLGFTGRASGTGHARAYYSTGRNAVYSRFSPNDWTMSNSMNYSSSDKERAFAERLRAEAWRAVKETDARTRNRQSEVTKKLGERVSDISFWKSELNSETNAMETEMANLKEYRRTLEKALGDTANPLNISEECLMHREKRHGIDLVHDDVEKSLNKETEVIKKCQVKMKRILEKAVVQLRMNRSAQHNMEIDAKDKNHAQSLDDRMHQIRNTSGGIGYHPGIDAFDNTVTIPYSWVKYTQENIARSQKDRAASERLRGEIDNLLRSCANEMWNQFNNVNNSFNGRLRETTDARNKLQAHLQRTLQEVFDMEKSIALLRKAIQDKEAPMKVAQTRLDERTRRINVELCNDPAMKSLQREIAEIRESVRILKDRLRAAEHSLARLLKTKANLEHDIQVKENSLHIDNKYCMGMRKGFPMDPKIGPIFQMPLSY